jgi:D-xylose transport system permease protein
MSKQTTTQTADRPLDAAGQPRDRITPSAVMARLAAGELGSVRVLIVLAFIWIVFQSTSDRFLSAVNLSNLALQIAGLGTIAIGVVLVLLLGEIDLSVGALSGLAAAVMAVLSVKHGVPGWLAVLAALVTGAVVGLVQGTISTRLGIPSFVITLAGLLAWQGALLAVLGETGTVNLTDPFITSLAGTFLPAAAGWALAVVGVVALVGVELIKRRQRAQHGLATDNATRSLIRVVAISVAILAATAMLNSDRGVPLSLLILIALVIAVHALLTLTTFGRHVYAVGGNAEAARRAGIGVSKVRTWVFVLGSTLAAAGGVLLASRLLAVNQSSGASDLLLLSIASGVIGGVSLFGGRGTVWAAVLGALVIGSISNGMDLLALESSVKFMVTGGVLAAAVSLDALTQRRRAGIRR